MLLSQVEDDGESLQSTVLMLADASVQRAQGSFLRD